MKLRGSERENHSTSEAQGSEVSSDASYHGDESAARHHVKEEREASNQPVTSGECDTARSAQRLWRPPGDRTTSESLLERFKDACDHMGPENALDCASCGQLVPDDPILTSCLCLYCTECFTEMLARAGKAVEPLPIPCAAYGEENIGYYISLTFGQWESLLQILDYHTETLCSSWDLEPKVLPDDVKLLWQQCQSVEARARGGVEHSRSSPELGNDSTELSSDGFDGESRSDGYEHDSGSDTTSQLGPISDYACVVDARDDTFGLVAGSTAENEAPCLRISSTEIKDLKKDVAFWGEPKTSASAGQETISHSPVRIDLTEGEDLGLLSPAANGWQLDKTEQEDNDDEDKEVDVESNEADNDEDGEEGEEEEEDDDSLCECFCCARARASRFLPRS